MPTNDAPWLDGELSKITAKQLMHLAEGLYGPDWAAPVARVTNVNLRTVQRIKAGAEKEEPHTRTAYLLDELKTAVLSWLPSFTLTEQIADMEEPDFIEIQDQISDAFDQNLATVTLDTEAMRALVGTAENHERRLWAIVRAALKLSYDYDSDFHRAQLEAEILNSADDLGAILGRSLSGKIEVVVRAEGDFKLLREEEGQAPLESFSWRVENEEEIEVALNVARGLYPEADIKILSEVTGYEDDLRADRIFITFNDGPTEEVLCNRAQDFIESFADAMDKRWRKVPLDRGQLH